MSEQSDEGMELYGPEDDGWYTSNTSDWIPLCPQLSDSAIRLYWIMRSLVIEKRGPVRKLSLMELAYLLPKRRFKPGETVTPSSMSRIRNLLRELTSVRLITTPEGGPLKTSSRAKAAAAGPLRIRINDRPAKGYHGPRNAFAALDAVRDAAAHATESAARSEAAREQQKRAARKTGTTDEGAADVGQNSDPHSGAGQNFDPGGQNSDPGGQNSDPDLATDQEKRDPPFRLPAQTSRSDTTPVRPSRAGSDACASATDGRTDGSNAPAKEHEPQQGEPSRLTRTPGVDLLLSIGEQDPCFLLTGATLRDQGAKVTGMLEEGWSPQLLRQVIAGRPLPDPVTTSVGAIISARLRAALASGPPPTPGDAMVPHQPQPAGGAVPMAGSGTTTADLDATEAPGRRVMAECAGCGRVAVAPGSDLCPTCLGWPECTGPTCHSSHTPRRTDPTTGGVCSRCQAAGERNVAHPPTDTEWEQLVAGAVAATDGAR